MTEVEGEVRFVTTGVVVEILPADAKGVGVEMRWELEAPALELGLGKFGLMFGPDPSAAFRPEIELRTEEGGEEGAVEVLVVVVVGLSTGRIAGDPGP